MKILRGEFISRINAEGHDLNELHALMAPRPFMVSGGRVDRPERWKALNSAIALYKFLGYENRIAMTNRAQTCPKPEIKCTDLFVF